MEHLHLTLPLVEWLVHDSGLTFAASSPLGFLRNAPRQSNPGQRAAAARTELAGRGVSFEARGNGGTATTTSAYRDAIELLARPAQRIQIIVQSPGQKTITMTLFARGGKACVFFFDQQAFHIGPCGGLEVTVGRLLDQLRPPRELEGQQILFWPSVLGLMTLLWPGAGQDLDQPVARQEALRRLGSPGVGEGRAESVLDELVEKTLLESKDGNLTVPAACRPWLQRALAGSFVQIDVLPLDAPEALEKPDDHTARLLFAGPPGGRVVSRRLEGEELARILEGTSPTEPRAIHLMALPPQPLTELLRKHLGLEDRAPSAPITA